jgi:hypothetical protein
MMKSGTGLVEWVAWGTFRVNGEEHGKTELGKVGVGKDIRVVGGKVSAWNERKGHLLTPEMITGVHGQRIEVLVIGIGAHGMIDCPAEVEAAIHAEGIGELILAPTPEACERYNALVAAGRRAALLAHGTC